MTGLDKTVLPSWHQKSHRYVLQLDQCRNRCDQRDEGEVEDEGVRESGEDVRRSLNLRRRESALVWMQWEGSGLRKRLGRGQLIPVFWGHGKIAGCQTWPRMRCLRSSVNVHPFTLYLYWWWFCVFSPRGWVRSETVSFWDREVVPWRQSKVLWKEWGRKGTSRTLIFSPLEVSVLTLLCFPQAIQAAHDAVAQEGQCRVNTS